jgi:hypothetical protein
MQLLPFVWEDSMAFLRAVLIDGVPPPQADTSSGLENSKSETTLNSQRSVVGYENPVRLEGIVSAADGCETRSVDIHSRVHGQRTFSYLASVSISSDGAWFFETPGLRNADYTATPAAEESCTTITSTPETVLVRAEVSIDSVTTCTNRNVAISGRVRPGAAGTKVLLQRPRAGLWRTLKRGALDRHSRYSLSAATPCQGRYRIVWPSQTDVNAKGTKTFRR